MWRAAGEHVGDDEAAIEALEQATSMNPAYHIAWGNLGEAFLSSDTDRALQSFETAEQLAEGRLTVNGRDPNILMDLAWIKSHLGEVGAAREFIERAKEVAPKDPYVHYFDALIEAHIDNRAAAISKLETAIRLGYPVAMVAGDTNFRALRNEPEFRTLTDSR